MAKSFEEQFGFDLSLLVESDSRSGGQPVLGTVNRNDVIRALETVLLDHERRDAYVSALKRLTANRVREDDAEETALVKGRHADLRFSWWPARNPPELEVGVAGGPLSFGAAECTARLLDAAGIPRATATVRDRKLVFPMPGQVEGE